MTPRQFFNGLAGKYEYDERLFKSQFYLFRYNAATTGQAFAGDKFAKAIYKQKAPWEKVKKTGLSASKIKAAFGAISKQNNKKD